jgi:hypothetical protein
MINEGKPGWEPMLPSGIAESLRTLPFGYDPNKEKLNDQLEEKKVSI